MKAVKLMFDIPTRWNSASMMLERAVHLKPTITGFLLNEPELDDLALSVREWEQSGALLKILYPFKCESIQIQHMRVPTID
jgi:hypothetical protein